MPRKTNPAVSTSETCPSCHTGIADTATGGRKAHHVDTAGKERNLTRLRRIEGQVRGLQKMVEEDRYCADVLVQLGAVQEALRAVGRELMRNHVRHCVPAAIAAGGEKAEALYNELVDLFYRNAR